MERTVPMDRLVCGDVGYGKTEIAVRAAFKAVQDGKQVAVLVPTTLLVTQHLSTFAERMSGFPVVLKGAVAGSRPTRRPARSIDGPGRRHGRHRDRHPPAAQPRHPVQGPRPGRRRRGAAVRRRAQGADEAAAHRRSTCCRMSATPIPRTLEMAITGIREMSTITTPPEERHPVLTYVGAYEDRQVVAADPARAAARGPGLLHPQPGAARSRRPRRGSASWCPRRGSRPRTARWASTSSSR